MKYRRRVLNKQCAKVSGVYNIPNSSYSAKGITEIIVFSIETPCWSPSGDSNMAAGNHWKHLEFTLALSKRLFSQLNLKIFA